MNEGAFAFRHIRPKLRVRKLKLDRADRLGIVLAKKEQALSYVRGNARRKQLVSAPHGSATLLEPRRSLKQNR